MGDGDEGEPHSQKPGPGAGDQGVLNGVSRGLWGHDAPRAGSLSPSTTH